MQIKEIKEEIEDTTRIHNNSTDSYFINLGFIKGLHRGKVITTLEMMELTQLIQKNNLIPAIKKIMCSDKIWDLSK